MMLKFRGLFLTHLVFCSIGFACASFANGTYAGPITVGFIQSSSLDFDIDSVDNYESVFVIKQIAQSLVEQNSNGKLISSVARYWTISKDMRTYSFVLREDLIFHDGGRVTSKDVEYSLNLVKNSSVNPLNIYLKRVKKIQSIGPFKIEIELKSPWFGFLHCLSSGLVPIFSYESHINKKNFVGSGSYNLVQKEGSWHFIKNEKYVGPYHPREPDFKILTPAESNQQPDILLNDLALYPGFTNYRKVDTDSFTSFNFMINPATKAWKDDVERIKLAKVLLEAKEIVKTPRLIDLKDVFPKGMLGYDINHKGFNKLMINIRQSDPNLMKKKHIVISSLGPILNFNKLADRLKSKYGIIAENYAVYPPDYLEKMRTKENIDVFTVGWASIFAHPDATFVPFYILGLADNGPAFLTAIDHINAAPTIASQYKFYRSLSYNSVSNGYVIPHSQVASELFVKQGIHAPKFRYRYTIQLAEVEKKKGLPQ